MPVHSEINHCNLWNKPNCLSSEILFVYLFWSFVLLQILGSFSFLPLLPLSYLLKIATKKVFRNKSHPAKSARAGKRSKSESVGKVMDQMGTSCGSWAIGSHACSITRSRKGLLETILVHMSKQCKAIMSSNTPPKAELYTEAVWATGDWKL